MDYLGGGGGAKGMLALPLKLLGGAGPPLPTPMNCLYLHDSFHSNT